MLDIVLGSIFLQKTAIISTVSHHSVQTPVGASIQEDPNQVPSCTIIYWHIMAFFQRRIAASLLTFVLWWILLGVVSRPVEAAKRMTDDHKQSVIAHLNSPSVTLSKEAPDAGSVSPECLTEWQLLLNSTDMISVLDSFGKVAPGTLAGNLCWFGHFDECMETDGYRHCLVNMDANLTALTNTPGLVLPIQWGVCAPEPCSEEDVRNSLELLLGYLDVPWLTLQNVLGSAAHCTEKDNTDMSAGFIATCVLLCVLVALGLTGSLVDHCMNDPTAQTPSPSSTNARPSYGTSNYDRNSSRSQEYEVLEDDNKPYSEINTDGGSATSKKATEKSPLLSSNDTVPASIVMSMEIQHTSKPSVLTRLLLCFAISRNLPKMLSTKQAEGGIPCLNGLRVISISWIILGHSLVLVSQAKADENILSAVQRWLQSFIFQVIANAPLAVDSFFFLSGLLLTFLTLKRLKETGGKMNWAWFYIHRYIRLTPTLALLILVLTFFLPVMNQGPVWFRIGQMNSFCREYWWTDLLYINNFVPDGLKDCVSWAWYLANDMQFYVLSPLIILPLFWFPTVGVTALIVTCLASFITIAVLVYQNDFLPGLFINLAGFFLPPIPGRSPGGQMDYQKVIYAKPYCRIPPYLVGMAMGYLLYRLGTKRVRLSPVISAAGWAVASALSIAVVFGLYDVNRGASVPTIAASMAYTSLSAFTWAVALSWVVFACYCGSGGIVNDFLSWSLWIPLGRLTYSTYLFHPVVIYVFAYAQAVPYHWSALTLIYIFASFVTLSHFVALIVALFLEFPVGNLEKMLRQALTRAS